MAETITTALLLMTFGLLMAISVLFSRVMERSGVPIVLLFLILGMLAGSEGIGGIDFNDYQFAFRVGTTALALILFDGGLNTPWVAARQGVIPASVLATVGVVITWGLTALGAGLLGIDWLTAFLLAAVISSTDAAAVFAVLRGSGLNLRRRLGVTLELESGLNDPMAVILTIAMTELALTGGGLNWSLLWMAPLQLLVGVLAGLGFGWLGVFLLTRMRLRASGLFPVLTLSIALMAFGGATLVQGSGFLAVYIAGMVIGNLPVPYRRGLSRIHDTLAWLGQILMFLLLGLLVYPSKLLDVFWAGAGVAFILTFIARPLAVLACLLPFNFERREIGYVGWVGLRGAVPIILATIPVLSGVPASHDVFNVVFFVVVVGAVIPGATVSQITSKLGLQTREPEPPVAVLEINSMQMLSGEILWFRIDKTLAVCDVPLSKISFPHSTAVILVIRGAELLAPRGSTVLREGDDVYVFAKPDDLPYVELLFGRGNTS